MEILRSFWDGFSPRQLARSIHMLNPFHPAFLCELFQGQRLWENFTASTCAAQTPPPMFSTAHASATGVTAWSRLLQLFRFFELKLTHCTMDKSSSAHLVSSGCCTRCVREPSRGVGPPPAEPPQLPDWCQPPRGQRRPGVFSTKMISIQYKAPFTWLPWRWTVIVLWIHHLFVYPTDGHLGCFQCLDG